MKSERKFPLAWYEKNLVNIRASEAMYLRQAADATSFAERCKCEYERLEVQLAEARRRGLTEFDQDRFMRPKKPKGTP